MRSFFIFLSFVVCPLSDSLLWGEEDVEMRAVQFAAFGDDFFDGLRFEVSEDRVVDLKFYPDRRTGVCLLPSQKRRVSFFRERRAADGKTIIREPQAEVDFEGIGLRALLIFTVSKNRERPYEVLVLDESNPAFGSGAVRFLNLTGVELKGKFGEEIFDLRLGVSDTLRFETAGWNPRALILAIAREGQKYTIVYSSSASIDPERGVLFVIKPPQSLESRIVSVQRLY